MKGGEVEGSIERLFLKLGASASHSEQSFSNVIVLQQEHETYDSKSALQV